MTSPSHSTPRSWQAQARPRAGLLGNPSDGYEGRVLAFTFEDFRARARCTLSESSKISLVGPDRSWSGSYEELCERLATRALEGGPGLLGAALLERSQAYEGSHLAAGLELSFESDVPRQVGLAGSSAIVVAALRALDHALGQPSDPFEVAEAALHAETQTLGVTAGPQDRVVQSYEGFLAMDFQAPRRPHRYRRLETGLLPDVWIAYDPAPGTSSGVAHSDIRGRYERGEAQVTRAMERFAQLADEGETALAEGDREGFADRLDESFDLRSSIWPLSDTDRALVGTARAHGLAAKLCGSGGAVVALQRKPDPGRLKAWRQALADQRLDAFLPRLTTDPQATTS